MGEVEVRERDEEDLSTLAGSVEVLEKGQKIRKARK